MYSCLNILDSINNKLQVGIFFFVKITYHAHSFKPEGIKIRAIWISVGWRDLNIIKNSICFISYIDGYLRNKDCKEVMIQKLIINNLQSWHHNELVNHGVINDCLVNQVQYGFQAIKK